MSTAAGVKGCVRANSVFVQWVVRDRVCSAFCLCFIAVFRESYVFRDVQKVRMRAVVLFGSAREVMLPPTASVSYNHYCGAYWFHYDSHDGLATPDLFTRKTGTSRSLEGRFLAPT